MSWFEVHRREMPWRGSDDPYYIWVSEMMLQQTQVATVIPYYKRWLETFPSIYSLAEADLDAVLKAWEGLGYYSRARNFKKGAEYLVKTYSPQIKEPFPFPYTEKEWQDVPGVGPYTAAAVSSIAFKSPAGVVDGNVIRILSRLFAMDENSTTLSFKRKIKELVESSFYNYHPGWVNQAWMEFGALQCVPNPDCRKCVLSEFCQAAKNGTVLHFPLKPQKKKIPIRSGRVYLVKKDNKYLMVQRPRDNFLGGLWEFPNDFKGRAENPDKKNDFTETSGLRILKETEIAVKHVYSHFKQNLILYNAELSGEWESPFWQAAGWFTLEEMQDLARPGVQIKIEKALKKNKK